jgi:CoA:oxalate CoA-transferase
VGGPLAGIRVLDFSRVLSGPHCGRALADLGADVVKVEPPEGDLTRFFLPRSGSMSRYFAQQNAGKRNLSLDLARPEAAGVVHRLLPRFDVLLENFRPGVMARLGLGYDDLRRLHPRLVYASITGWGQDGPETDRRAYAVVVQAEAGMTARSLRAHGDEDAPVNDPFSHADVYAGLQCLSGILAALVQRERTGDGQHVDVAMVGALLNVNEHAQAELDPTWSDPGGGGPVLRAGDRLVTCTADPCARGSFELYVQAMGRPELLDDERFRTPADRFRNRAALLSELQRWVDGLGSVAALADALAAVRIPVGVVRTVAEVAESPWARHRGAVVEVDDRQGGTIRIPEAAWRFSGAEAGVAGPPAWRGEHNRQVLAESGFSSEEIDRLEADGILSSRVTS